jgi:hypothetical protein
MAGDATCEAIDEVDVEGVAVCCLLGEIIAAFDVIPLLFPTDLALVSAMADDDDDEGIEVAFLGFFFFFLPEELLLTLLLLPPTDDVAIDDDGMLVTADDEEDGDIITDALLVDDAVIVDIFAPRGAVMVGDDEGTNIDDGMVGLTIGPLMFDDWEDKDDDTDDDGVDDSA